MESIDIAAAAKDAWRSGTQGSSVSYHDFLDRMRNPASFDLVRSIKSFIVSFSFYAATPESDSERFQDFLLRMEAAIRDHPLWAAATEEEIDSALEGVEKYVMTKLFSRTFALSSEDARIDDEISKKICLLQKFVKPEHLDIPSVFHDKSSWLLAERELQSINSFMAPRDKLVCVLKCCRVINNILLNVAMRENLVPGADDFLPILIYVTIKASSQCHAKRLDTKRFCGSTNIKEAEKANPAKIQSNLKYIQLYRRQAKLISEAAYHLTNLVSAKSFILYLEAKSLTIDETDFMENMQATRLASGRNNREPYMSLNETTTLPASSTRDSGKQAYTEPSCNMDEMIALAWSEPGGGITFPFMEAEADKLSVGDLKKLLCVYKDVVNKYTRLCKAVRHFSVSTMERRAPDSGKNIRSEQTENHQLYLRKEEEELPDTT